ARAARRTSVVADPDHRSSRRLLTLTGAWGLARSRCHPAQSVLTGQVDAQGTEQPQQPGPVRKHPTAAPVPQPAQSADLAAEPAVEHLGQVGQVALVLLKRHFVQVFRDDVAFLPWIHRVPSLPGMWVSYLPPVRPG